MSETNNDKHNVTELDMDNKRYVSESQLLADLMKIKALSTFKISSQFHITRSTFRRNKALDKLQSNQLTKEMMYR